MLSFFKSKPKYEGHGPHSPASKADAALLMEKHIKIDGRFTVENGKVYVDGNVLINDTPEDLVQIPVQFGYITGDLTISNAGFINLKGCPLKIGGSFNCRWCSNLESLEGGPRFIEKGLYRLEMLPMLESLDHLVESAPKIYLSSISQVTTAWPSYTINTELLRIPGGLFPVPSLAQWESFLQNKTKIQFQGDPVKVTTKPRAPLPDWDQLSKNYSDIPNFVASLHEKHGLILALSPDFNM